MDFRAKITLVTLLQFISTVKLTSAYCEFGICEPWESCCGANQCCPNHDRVYDNLITAVCILLAALVFCCIIFFISRYCCRFGRPMIDIMFGNYMNLSRDRGSSTSNLAARDVEYDERIYSDPPPSYSEVVGNTKARQTFPRWKIRDLQRI